MLFWTGSDAERESERRCRCRRPPPFFRERSTAQGWHRPGRRAGGPRPPCAQWRARGDRPASYWAGRRPGRGLGRGGRTALSLASRLRRRFGSDGAASFSLSRLPPPPSPLLLNTAGQDPAPGIVLVQRHRQGGVRGPGKGRRDGAGRVETGREARAASPSDATRPTPILNLAPLRSIQQSGSVLYPVVVRFEKPNYAGVSTNNYALDEVKEV